MTADLGVGQKVYVWHDPRIDPGNEHMRFRLTYQGELMSNGSANHKHEIRRVFHRQMRKLWKVSPNLATLETTVVVEGKLRQIPDWQRIATLDDYSRSGYRFVPLVARGANVLISVNVLYLRHGQPGQLLMGGDIDNRLKTIFDALRMPHNGQELGGYTAPGDDEDPFFVLVEDDGQIIQVSVETDTLLEPIPSASGHERGEDARLVLTVEIYPVRVDSLNRHFT